MASVLTIRKLPDDVLLCGNGQRHRVAASKRRWGEFLHLRVCRDSEAPNGEDPATAQRGECRPLSGRSGCALTKRWNEYATSSCVSG
jgi:hypothetical protein